MTGSMALNELIARLQEAMQTFDKLLFDESYPHELGAPCTQAQLTQLERIFGRPAPPSYCAFISHYNGWSKFDGDAKLLAVEDFGSASVRQRLEGLSVLFYEVGFNPFHEGCIPIMLGEDARVFLVADPRTVGKDGEITLPCTTSYRSTGSSRTSSRFSTTG